MVHKTVKARNGLKNGSMNSLSYSQPFDNTKEFNLFKMFLILFLNHLICLDLGRSNSFHSQLLGVFKKFHAALNTVIILWSRGFLTIQCIRMQTEKKLISRRELAESLQVTYMTIHNLTKAKKIPFYQVGGQYRYDLEEVKKSFINQTTKEVHHGQ